MQTLPSSGEKISFVAFFGIIDQHFFRLIFLLTGCLAVNQHVSILWNNRSHSQNTSLELLSPVLTTNPEIVAGWIVLASVITISIGSLPFVRRSGQFEVCDDGQIERRNDD